MSVIMCVQNKVYKKIQILPKEAQFTTINIGVDKSFCKKYHSAPTLIVVSLVTEEFFPRAHSIIGSQLCGVR